MANTREFVDHVLELARAAGRPSARAMFGGHGLYLDALIVGIVIDDTLWLKCDPQALPAFVARSLPAFEYVSRDGSRTLTSYRRAPDEALEGTEAMREWLRLAHGAALRAAAGKRAQRPRAAKRSRA